jgi:hypothetical protein
MEKLLPFIKSRSQDGRFVLTNKGNQSRELQKSVGDLLFNDGKTGAVWTVEIKSEYTKRPNLFLETWSNRSRFTPGWMFTLANVDLLFYYFIESSDLYIMRFDKLRRWSFGGNGTPGNIYAYEEKQQRKYNQMNDTCGRCVPIDIIRKSVGFVYRNLDDTANLSQISPASLPPNDIPFATNLFPLKEEWVPV